MVHLAPWRPASGRVQGVLAATPAGSFTYPYVGGSRPTDGAAVTLSAEASNRAVAASGRSDARAAREQVRTLGDEIASGRYAVDANSCTVGSGSEDFEAAREALLGWEHFQLGWTHVDRATRVVKGEKVAVVAQAVLPWTINPLEVVYVDDSRAQQSRNSGRAQQTRAQGRRVGSARKGGAHVSFGHGTTHGHLLSGEERFTVRWDPDSDEVTYEVVAFSRPGHPLAAITYPVVRLLQRRFARDSMKAFTRAVARRRAERGCSA